jgi:hypothetical protein
LALTALDGERRVLGQFFTQETLFRRFPAAHADQQDELIFDVEAA